VGRGGGVERGKEHFSGAESHRAAPGVGMVAISLAAATGEFFTATSLADGRYQRE